MSGNDILRIGEALPRIRAVSSRDGYEIAVMWDDATRGGALDVVDLAPLLFRLKFYAPLRDDPHLRTTVHLVDEGTAIAWGDGEVDMAATSVLDLAEEVRSPADLGAFARRHGFTLARLAAELGISERLAAHYAGGGTIPRYIDLACRFIDLEARSAAAVQGEPSQAQPADAA